MRDEKIIFLSSPKNLRRVSWGMPCSSKKKEEKKKEEEKKEEEKKKKK